MGVGFALLARHVRAIFLLCRRPLRMEPVTIPLDLDTARATARSVTRLPFAARQVLLIIGAIGAYFGARGLTEGRTDIALRNAEWLVDIEHALGVAFETSIQRAAVVSESVGTLANWIYIWGHWPVVIGTLVVLAVGHRPGYYQLRNMLFVAGAIGLLFYINIPMAPPRLFSSEFVDTVTEQSNAYRVLQPPAFVNKYAALPSLHFGFNLLVGLAWFRYGRHRAWRVAGVAMPLAMGWAVIATANHWIVDVLLGGAVALTAVAIADRWTRRSRRAANPAALGHTGEHADGSRARPALRMGRRHVHPVTAGHRTRRPAVGRTVARHPSERSDPARRRPPAPR